MPRKKDYVIIDSSSPYPFWEMLAIWVFLGAAGFGLAFVKALPAIIASLILAAPILTICTIALMMTGTAMFLAIRNNDARYWFLPVFPVVLLAKGLGTFVNLLRGGEAFQVFGPVRQYHQIEDRRK